MDQERAARYLALDPGETTGWATFDDKGVIIRYGQVKQEDLHTWMDLHITSDLLAVICEEYRIYSQSRQRTWSRNQTSKNEGALETVAALRNVPFFLQPANVKKMGYKWCQLEPPSNHNISHQFDAIAHGTFWLVTHQVISAISIIPKNER